MHEKALRLMEAKLEVARLELGYNERQFALYLGLDPAGFWRIRRGKRAWGRMVLERVRVRYPELVPDALLQSARLLGPGATGYGERTVLKTA